MANVLREVAKTKKKELWSDLYPKHWSLFLWSFFQAPLSPYFYFASSLICLKDDTFGVLRPQNGKNCKREARTILDFGVNDSENLGPYS